MRKSRTRGYRSSSTRRELPNYPSSTPAVNALVKRVVGAIHGAACGCPESGGYGCLSLWDLSVAAAQAMEAMKRTLVLMELEETTEDLAREVAQ